jgi:hypothetical protein
VLGHLNFQVHGVALEHFGPIVVFQGQNINFSLQFLLPLLFLFGFFHMFLDDQFLSVFELRQSFLFLSVGLLLEVLFLFLTQTLSDPGSHEFFGFG